MCPVSFFLAIFNYRFATVIYELIYKTFMNIGKLLLMLKIVSSKIEYNAYSIFSRNEINYSQINQNKISYLSLNQRVIYTGLVMYNSILFDSCHFVITSRFF